MTAAVLDRHARRRRSLLWLAVALVAASCASSGHGTTTLPAPTTRVGTVPPHHVHHTSRHHALHAPTAGRSSAGPGPGGWVTLATSGGTVAVGSRLVALSDGARVTVFRFRAGVTSFALHAGSLDPGQVAGSPHRDRVTGSERSRLLAAFNGAFKVSAGTGGYEQDGIDVRPLRSGLATFVIDAAGRGSVGVWHGGSPRAGARVVSAVQNLAPLVAGGRMSPRIDDRLSWGATLGHVLRVARSAVGEDARGDVLYAAGMSVSPRDIAAALIATGSVNAMELDINPEWVQLDFAARPGGMLHVGVPGQHRPAGQFLSGWTRSFITVLSGP